MANHTDSPSLEGVLDEGESLVCSQQVEEAEGPVEDAGCASALIGRIEPTVREREAA